MQLNFVLVIMKKNKIILVRESTLNAFGVLVLRELRVFYAIFVIFTFISEFFSSSPHVDISLKSC